MDSESNSETKTVEIVLSVKSVASSEELPIEQWSSLESVRLEEQKKKQLYRDGLYDPGSGELCAEYITMSASSVLRHPYYKYPPIIDPGIERALLAPEDLVKYPADGQALYLATCREMNQCPVRSFYRGLLGRQIDLRYYCINPNGFRAMAKALEYNDTVQVLNLTDNFLNDDACFHMGDLLLTNKTITELNLRGCRIGPEGASRLFCKLHYNQALKVLDLSYNQLGDGGMKYLARSVLFGLDVKKLNLSYNNISGKGFALLGEAMETHNKFTHLDLSWNQMFTIGGHAFLTKLSESTCLEVLNLSWNSLSGSRIGQALKGVVSCPLLSELNLSHNKLEGEAITAITEKLTRAKKLESLNLSYNPMSPRDALNVLNKVAIVTSNVKNVFMDNVTVDGAFLSLLKIAKESESKKDLVVTYGGVVGVFKAKGPDAREVVLNRVEYVMKSKKGKTDIALISQQLQKDNKEIMIAQDLSNAFKAAGALIDEDLVLALCLAFPGPLQKNPKIKTVNINLLVDYNKRKWPDRKLPPTPPPEPEPEPAPEVKPTKPQGKRKGKK